MSSIAGTESVIESSARTQVLPRALSTHNNNIIEQGSLTSASRTQVLSHTPSTYKNNKLQEGISLASSSSNTRSNEYLARQTSTMQVPLSNQAPRDDRIETTFTSYRARALLRFIIELKTTLGRSDIPSIFHQIRYHTRFAEALNDPQGDEGALSANSEEDELMILVIESCFLDVGYAVLRSLALWREFGRYEIQQLGIFAIIRSTLLKNQFMVLVKSTHYQLGLFAGKRIVSTSSLKSTQAELGQCIAWIRGTEASIMYDIDSIFKNSSYCAVLQCMNIKELMEEETALAALALHPTVLYARMLMQASQTSFIVTKQFDFPYRIESSSSTSTPQHSGIFDVCKGIALDNSGELNWTVTLTAALGEEGSQLQYASAYINTELESLLGVVKRDDENIVLQRILTSGNLVWRMKLVEAVTMRINLEKDKDRSDSRKALIMQMRDLLEMAELWLADQLRTSGVSLESLE
ncbi:MAG: hypothetical protein P4L69_03355 [Desulfosporosinus sp.]|nr:hypothetical protein [Desulfosporosinus sp.]